MKIFAERIKELRTEKGLTLKKVAEELEVSYVSLHEYENNKYEPSHELTLKIAQYYNVSIGYLFGVED